MLSTAPIRAYIPALDVRRARNFYEQIGGGARTAWFKIPKEIFWPSVNGSSQAGCFGTGGTRGGSGRTPPGTPG